MEDLGKCRSIPWKHPWHRDDFDPCFRELFIESLVPAIVIVASVAIAALATLRTLRQRTLRPSTNRFSYLPLIQGKAQLHNNRQGGVSTSTSSGYGSINSEEQPTEWDGWHSDSSSSDDNSDDGRDKAIDDTPPPQGQQPISIRDTLLVSLSALQLLWGVLLFGDNGKDETSVFEVLLWLWAVVLCVYIFYRPDLRWPSPSPHLRFVYTAGFAVDAIKTRTALLAYSREEINAFPKIPIAMAAAAGVLFFASFTQQRRSHGLPSSTPVGASSGNPPAPEMTASIAQLLFFSWMDPMICLGYKRSLEPNDVYDIMPEDRSAYVCARWNRENQTYIQTHGRDTRSLTRRLFWYFRYRLALQCLWTLVNTIFIFTGPFLLKRILAYMEDDTIYTREQAFWCVAGLLGGGTISTVCQSQALWIGRKIGMHIKAIVIGEVYTKSLRRRDAASSESSSTTSTTPSSSSSSVAATDEDDGSSSRKGNQDAVNNGDTGNEGGSENTSTTSVGKITNLMAVDAHKISEVSAYLHFLYQLPAEMVITMVMLYQLLGVASLAGLCAIIMLVPLQWYLVSVWSVFQNQLMKASDRRMGMMNEILQGVRIIKFFGWEPQFEKQVASVRGCELSVLRKRYLVLTCSIMLFFMAPVFVTLATFGVHTKVMGRPLTASVAFTALALFKTLRGPMDQLPDFFSFCLQAKVSVDRVAKFLAEEDTPKYELTRLTRKAHSGVVGRRRRPSYAEVVGATDIGFIDASFSWQKARGSSGRIGDSNVSQLNVHSTETEIGSYETTTVEPLLAGASTGVADTVVVSDVDSSEEDAVTFQLQQLTASFPVGKLSIIAGPTGSGKTSMLMALLGEMRLTKGQLMVPGAMFNAGVVLGGNPLDPFSVHESVAYVAQQAWLLNDTIRGNITFGMPYDEQRYREVVRMCALARDFEILEAGDMTEVGERGVALSGGQKQRICLA
ncbi:Transporter of the ATP-binding cassette (ABC), partial [Coemansia sp. RSA 1285]